MTDCLTRSSMKKLAIALTAMSIHRRKQIKVKADWTQCKLKSKHLPAGACCSCVKRLCAWGVHAALTSSAAGVWECVVQRRACVQSVGRCCGRLCVISSVSCVCFETKPSPASRWVAGRSRPPRAWPGSDTYWSETPSPVRLAALCCSWSSGGAFPEPWTSVNTLLQQQPVSTAAPRPEPTLSPPQVILAGNTEHDNEREQDDQQGHHKRNTK